MVTIDPNSIGVMDKVNVEQQKQSHLVDGMKDLAKTDKAEARTDPAPAVDTVAISDRARQKAAARQTRAAREPGTRQEEAGSSKAADRSGE